MPEMKPNEELIRLEIRITVPDDTVFITVQAISEGKMDSMRSYHLWHQKWIQEYTTCYPFHCTGGCDPFIFLRELYPTYTDYSKKHLNEEAIIRDAIVRDCSTIPKITFSL